MSTLPFDPDRSQRAQGGAGFWLSGMLGLWASYVLVFSCTGGGRLDQEGLDALCNVLPLGVLALAVRAVLASEVMRRPPWAQALWHGALAPAFSFTWYATLTLLLALSGELRGYGFHLRGFQGPALTWQAFQGLMAYSAVAALCYALSNRQLAPATPKTDPRPAPSLTRYLIRTDDELTPIDIDDVISITGAQDYAEVATAAGRHLVRLSLAEFEARLDPARFIRVHRSAIINLHRLTRTEPAGGGRLVAFMSNGDRVAVSRSGVQEIRRFVI